MEARLRTGGLSLLGADGSVSGPRLPPALRWVAALSLLGACLPAPGPPATSVAGPGRIEVGAPLPCAAPTPGFARLQEEAAARGLGEPLPERPDDPTREGRGGSVAVADLDRDGDDDLVVAPFGELPRADRNDGRGHFESLAVPPMVDRPLDFRAPVAAVDLSSDGWPDLVTHDVGRVIVWPGAPDGFEAPQTWFERPGQAPPHSLAFALADADGDGPLDLLIVTTTAGGPEGAVGPSLLLRNTGSAFEPLADLRAAAEDGVTSQVGLFTDRDRDGDLDVFVPTNAHARPTAFFRRAGAAWIDDAAAIGADLRVAGMGVDSADLDGDGQLDYCVTDVGPPRCLLSAGELYIEDGPGLGLEPAVPVDGETSTIGWSFDFADFDNDGRLDAVQASGPDLDFDERGLRSWPDLIWQGAPGGGFVDRTAAVGFGDVGIHFGLATGDFDADGWVDVLVAGPGGPPRLWMNRCGAGGWLDVTLAGPTGNPDGIGALLELEAGARRQLREVYGLRATGQSTPRVHFGLGDAGWVDRLSVRWPDGATTEVLDLPAGRAVTVFREE